MGRPVSGAGRGTRAPGGGCRVGPGDGGGLRASGCGWPGTGSALASGPALSPRRLALRRRGLRLEEGGSQAGPGVPVLGASCPGRMLPVGGLGDGDASLEITAVLRGELGREARAGGRRVLWAGWRLGSQAPARTQESTPCCTLSQERDGCFGSVLAHKAGLGAAEFRARSLPESSLPPGCTGLFSPSFGPLPCEPERAR